LVYLTGDDQDSNVARPVWHVGIIAEHPAVITAGLLLVVYIVGYTMRRRILPYEISKRLASDIGTASDADAEGIL
jgi:hypothetical protein